MEAIRLISTELYDHKLGRFQSTAFTNSSSRGISIIDKECIHESGACTCDHIRKYYQSIAGEPPVFWQFSTDILPDHCRLEQQDTPSGDHCHYNILGLTDRQAKRLFKEQTQDLSGLFICIGECERVLQKDDTADFGVT